MRILLIEDDPETSRFLRKGLEEAGPVVDQMLPGLDDLSIMRSLREGDSGSGTRKEANGEYALAANHGTTPLRPVRHG